MSSRFTPRTGSSAYCGADHRNIRRWKCRRCSSPRGGAVQKSSRFSPRIKFNSVLRSRTPGFTPRAWFSSVLCSTFSNSPLFPALRLDSELRKSAVGLVAPFSNMTEGFWKNFTHVLRVRAVHTWKSGQYSYSSSSLAVTCPVFMRQSTATSWKNSTHFLREGGARAARTWKSEQYFFEFFVWRQAAGGLEPVFTAKCCIFGLRPVGR